MILTNDKGVPFVKPEAPSPNASSDEVIAFLRAFAAYNDAVSSCGNRAFSTRFTKAVRK